MQTTPAPHERQPETLENFRREPTGWDAVGRAYYYFEMVESIGGSAGMREEQAWVEDGQAGLEKEAPAHALLRPLLAMSFGSWRGHRWVGGASFACLCPCPPLCLPCGHCSGRGRAWVGARGPLALAPWCCAAGAAVNPRAPWPSPGPPGPLPATAGFRLYREVPFALLPPPLEAPPLDPETAAAKAAEEAAAAEAAAAEAARLAAIAESKVGRVGGP